MPKKMSDGGEDDKDLSVESIVINKNCYFYSVATEKQKHDISTYCCSGNDVLVLGIDTTYNVCDMFFTDSCYWNKSPISNTSGAHPVSLRPTLFHFKRDTQTFTRIALEIQGCNTEARGIKKTGVDMEDAIYLKWSENCFPEVQQLFCV